MTKTDIFPSVSVFNINKHLYLISALSVQLLLVFEPIHHLLHERQCDHPIFKFGAYVVILNRCNWT